MRYLLLPFIIVPIAELALLINVGGHIGFWPTLAIVLATAFLGTSLMRYQGLSVIRRVQTSLDKGEIPIDSMFDGLCLLMAGALMITPGFITDIAGILLLIPFIRRKFASLVLKRLITKGNLHVFSSDQTNGSSDQADLRKPSKSQSSVIDAEYEEVNQAKDIKVLKDKGLSPWKKSE